MCGRAKMARRSSAMTRVGHRVVVADGSIGWNWSRVFQRNALAFAEKGKQHQRYESEALQNDGNGDGTLLDAAGALFELRIAFDETVAE